MGRCWNFYLFFIISSISLSLSATHQIPPITDPTITAIINSMFSLAQEEKSNNQAIIKIIIIVKNIFPFFFILSIYNKLNTRPWGKK